MILVDNFWSITYHFIWTDIMLAFLRSLGKHSFSKKILKRIDNRFEIEEAYLFIIWIDISSCLWTLLGSNGLIIFTKLSEQISKIENFSSVLNVCWDRTVVVYSHTLLTKVIIKQISFYQTFSDKLLTN